MALSPAYAKYPEHTLSFAEERGSLRVSVGDIVIAETRSGLVLTEGKYPSVVYVPRGDVFMDRLAVTKDETTFCPFKGNATYYDCVATSTPVVQIGWSYEDPFDQMEALRGHLAFYSDRAKLEPLSE